MLECHSHSRGAVLRFGLGLLIGLFLVGCSEAATPTNAPATARLTATTLAASATLTKVTPAGPTEVQSPRPSPSGDTATATPSSQPVALAAVGCEPAAQWSQTQNDLTAVACFDPLPPQLGRPGIYEVLLADAAGQPLSDATVEVTLVGGMAGMAGEHDEDFSMTLESQGAGLYKVEATIGPTDLVLTEVRIKVQRGRELWSFSISVDDLAPP